MTTINIAYYTRQDQVFLITFQLSKEQIKKDNERDLNIAKIMTTLDIISKNVMVAGTHGVNDVGVGITNSENMKFRTLYSEEANF